MKMGQGMVRARGSGISMGKGPELANGLVLIKMAWLAAGLRSSVL